MINITRLVIDNCSLVDWNTLLQQCSVTNYLRITGIDMDGDESLLRGLMTMGGADEDEENVQTRRLVGMYRLTQSMSDEEYAVARAHFPELNIIQSQFVCMKMDQTVGDGEKTTNLDNFTGYDYNTEFAPSSHILEVLAKRHYVLARKTAESEITCYPPHDKNRNKYADSNNMENATDTVLTGLEGEVYVYEPHCWYKGVTDMLNQRPYDFISSNEGAPAAVEYTSVKPTRERLEVAEGIGTRKSMDYTTLEEAKNEYESGSFALVDVRGYKQVRFPGLASTLYGAVFIDDTGKTVSRISVSNVNGFVDGMYLFYAVPAGATKPAFTFPNSATFDFVLPTTSESVEAIEPDWIEYTECLDSAYEAYLIDDVLCFVSGVSSVGTISRVQAVKYAQNRGKGFQLFDWEIHKDVGNLHFFKHGNTDSQGVRGYGTNNYQKVAGLTSTLEARNTVSYYKERGGSNPQAEGTRRDGVNRQSINVLEYENPQGSKVEWLQYVTVNKTVVDGR